MKHYIHSARIIHGLLAVSITITAGSPLAAYAAAPQANDKAQQASTLAAWEYGSVALPSVSANPGCSWRW